MKKNKPVIVNADTFKPYTAQDHMKFYKPRAEHPEKYPHTIQVIILDQKELPKEDPDDGFYMTKDSYLKALEMAADLNMTFQQFFMKVLEYTCKNKERLCQKLKKSKRNGKTVRH
jgi:hypothetical protein